MNMAFLRNRSLTLGSKLIFGMTPVTNFCQRRLFSGFLLASTACFNEGDVNLLRRAHSVHTSTLGTTNSTDALNKVSLSPHYVTYCANIIIIFYQFIMPSKISKVFFCSGFLKIW